MSLRLIILSVFSIFSVKVSSQYISNIKDEINNKFNKFVKHPSINFSGIDSSFFYINSDTILVLSEFNSGDLIQVLGYNDGKIFRESNFKDGSQYGAQMQYYDNGELKTLTVINTTETLSPIITWYNDGSIKSYTNFNKGLIINWYTSGNLKSKITYLDSITPNEYVHKYVEETYFKNGNLSSTRAHNMGKQPFTLYYDNSNIKSKGFIFNSELLRINEWQEWHENGQLSREYYFHDSIPNQREGIWKWWNKEGNLIKEEKYKNGELIDTKEYLLEIEKETD